MRKGENLLSPFSTKFDKNGYTKINELQLVGATFLNLKCRCREVFYNLYKENYFVLAYHSSNKLENSGDLLIALM